MQVPDSITLLNRLSYFNNQNQTMQHTSTQLERLQGHFNKGGKVTRLTAFIDLGICELSSRIGELEKSGFPIHKQMIHIVNRYGEQVRVMEYRKDNGEG